MQFGVNHLAHFQLFLELQDLLLSSATPSRASRVVNTSSTTHRTAAVHFEDPHYKHRQYDAVCLVHSCIAHAILHSNPKQAPVCSSMG